MLFNDRIYFGNSSDRRAIGPMLRGAIGRDDGMRHLDSKSHGVGFIIFVKARPADRTVPYSSAD
ncbi:MAG: hypothetical protein ACRC9V_13320, partial [Aeromonas sp.]